MQIRDRIQDFRRVLARDLQPNPRNWRTHPAPQQDALRGILAEVGYAGALLAREVAGGGLQLVDGHLRAETTPDQLVPVLVLDVSEAEANKLLAFYDPLSSLAGRDEELARQLAAEVETSCPVLQELLQSLRGDQAADAHAAESDDALAASYQLVVQCADEAQQRELFERLSAEGLSCKVLTM
ncbi:hypothetical protein [Anatilimnocola floriformis]|uniref:hypothetical protein n=1 Tax=Anatilimnocola floriformis TaxID=2948575 RepID=UPI0020C3BF95|nr:hypothetical protein [Anatilimnocola floriformis]